MKLIIGTPIFEVNRNSDWLMLDNIGMSIGSRIKEARKHAKLSQKALAQKVGMSQSSLSELETGESSGTTLIASFAAALGVNALWLETGKGPATGPHLAVVQTDDPAFSNDSPFIDDAMPVRIGDEPNMVPVRMVTLRLRAGMTGFETEPDLVDGGQSSIPSHVIEQLRLDTRDLIAMRIRGTSMEPLMFEDDVIIVNTGDRKPVSREIYAINWNGEACVKMLVHRGGSWYLHSINPEHGPVNVRSGQCSIVGRVVYQPGRVLTGRL